MDAQVEYCSPQSSEFSVLFRYNNPSSAGATLDFKLSAPSHRCSCGDRELLAKASDAVWYLIKHLAKLDRQQPRSGRRSLLGILKFQTGGSSLPRQKPRSTFLFRLNPTFDPSNSPVTPQHAKLPCSASPRAKSTAISPELLKAFSNVLTARCIVIGRHLALCTGK